MNKRFIKTIVVGGVLGALTASTALANDADDKLALFRLTAKPTDVVCEGKSIYKRPLWMQIVTAGLLGGTYGKDESVTVPAVPGGVDAIRLLIERNPESRLFLAKIAGLAASDVIKSDATCTSTNQEPLELHFSRDREGKVIYEFEEAP